MSKRIIAVGDIHGCARALETLLETIKPGPEDTIVILGDFIDRGLDTKGVIDQLIRLKERCHLVLLMGNHEEMFLGALESISELQFWLKFGGKQALDSWGVKNIRQIPTEHLEFIRSCQKFYESDTHIFAHANYWANRPMQEQPTTALFWDPLDVKKAYLHFTQKTVVVGHTPQKDGNILDLGYLVCIGTFCHGGGWLTALEMNSGEYWQANERGACRKGRK